MENIVLDLKPIGNTVRIGKLNKKRNLLLQTKFVGGNLKYK